MIINHKSGKGGVVGKDGTTPHIGANGNWFLGETDTGVAAQGKSDTRIETIMLPVADWDSETLSQVITCTGVLEDEAKQIITTVALPGNEEVCEACHIICSAFAKDTLTFTATELPSVDVYIYVILENVSGGDNVSNNVYSTEETVVGTWLDGKPIYRKTVLISTGNVTNSDQCIDVPMDMTTLNIEKVINIHGQLELSNAHIPIPTPGVTNYYCMLLYIIPSLVLRTNNPNWSNSPCYITMEYTKTTDTATVEIPSATAMMDAYEEGVNEA